MNWGHLEVPSRGERSSKKPWPGKWSIALIAVGLAIVGHTILGQWQERRLQEKAYEDLLRYAEAAAAEANDFDENTLEPLGEEDELGILVIPKIDVVARIVEGIDDRQLYYGVGHTGGTAIPGEAGNSVLAGHRTSYRMHPFRDLDKVSEGDLIEVVTPEKTTSYTVFEILVVEPTDRAILKQNKNETILTLYTCHPPGSLEYRLVVKALLTE